MPETKLYVYWCPRCEVQTERPWHLCRRGPALIPQMDEETQCERIEVVPAAASAEHSELARKILADAPLVEQIPLWAIDSAIDAGEDAVFTLDHHLAFQRFTENARALAVGAAEEEKRDGR